MVRRTLAAAALTLLLLAGTAQAQVDQAGLAPFVGKYGDGTGRHDAYITTDSGLTLTYYFGGGCSVVPYPCDPPNGGAGNLPGGRAVAAIWGMDNGDLVGSVLSADSPGLLDVGPIRVVRINDQAIEIRQGENRQTFTRAR